MRNQTIGGRGSGKTTTQQQINHDASRLYNASRDGRPLPDVCGYAKAKARILWKTKRGAPSFILAWHDPEAV